MHILREQIRQRISATPHARRLFHGRGRCFPGLHDVTIDWLPPVVHLKLYHPRDEAWLHELVALIRCEVASAVAILLQERFLPGSPSSVLWGQMPAVLEIEEAGLRFRVRLGASQNTGFFLDMARGRQLVREHAADRKILNLFAYTCSFSVAALAGQARQVVNLDMNKNALALGKTNHLLNQLDGRRVSFLPMEFFRSVSKLRKLGPFDLVICDPPAAQGRSFSARTHWPKLIQKLPSLLSDDAEIVACLNARAIPSSYLREQFALGMPQARLLESLQAGPDFPEADPHAGLIIERYGFHRDADP
ncbi:MAG: class I SAM-dependent methyltransferase [Pseudomonadota bacterium]